MVIFIYEYERQIQCQVLNTLSKVPLNQKNHPMLIESEHHHI